MNHEPNEAPRLLRLPEVLKQTGLGRTTVFDLVRCGKFPPPVRLTSSARAWIEGEVSAWIDARIAARHAKPSRLPEGQNAGGAP